METNNDLIPVTFTRDSQGTVQVELGHIEKKGAEYKLWTQEDIDLVSSTRQGIRKLLSDYFA